MIARFTTQPTIVILLRLIDYVDVRDSISRLWFPFLSHDKVFSDDISLVCCLKYPYNCFSSHFCFRVIVVLLILLLFVLFLFAVIGLFCFFLIKSSNRFIDIQILSSLLANPLPPSFLDANSLSMPSLGCLMHRHKFSCSLVCLLGSLLVYFKNGSEYLARETAQVFIPLMRFLQYSLVLSSFRVLLRYSFKFFSFMSTYLWVIVSNIPNFCKFPFFPTFLIFC